MKLRIQTIEAAASDRPEGYLAAVLSRGTINGEWLDISSEALAELRGIYRPLTPQVAAKVIVRVKGSKSAGELHQGTVKLRECPNCQKHQ